MASVREDGGLNHSSSNSNATCSREPYPQQKVHVYESLTDLTTFPLLLYLVVNLLYFLYLTTSSGLNHAATSATCL